eukprot:1047132-Pyramimonas_sp.AAC.1
MAPSRPLGPLARRHGARGEARRGRRRREWLQLGRRVSLGRRTSARGPRQRGPQRGRQPQSQPARPSSGRAVVEGL